MRPTAVQVPEWGRTWSRLGRAATRRSAVQLEEGADAGFTLIELMVVLLVMAILMAIAIPTFLQTTQTAKDTSAQADLNTAMTAALAYYDSDGQVFNGSATTGIKSALTTAEPEISWTTGVASTGQVHVVADGENMAIFATLAPTGRCWYLTVNEGTGPSPVWGAGFNAPTTGGVLYAEWGTGSAGKHTSCTDTFGTPGYTGGAGTFSGWQQGTFPAAD